MKLLFKGWISQLEEEEEIDLDLTEEQYNKYLETGKLPGQLGEDLFHSLIENSDAGFNLRKIL